MTGRTFSNEAQIFGFFFWLVLLSAGIIKCWFISRRPTTSFKCVLALQLFLLAWVVMFFSIALFGPNAFDVPLPLHLRFFLYTLGRFLAIALILSSLILAIIGLIEYNRAPGRYSQGRVQAISTIVLCGIFGIAVVAMVANRTAARQGLANQPVSYTPLVFEDLNFKFSSPGMPWVPIDPARMNTNAQVAFIRAAPDAYFMIIAEKEGVQSLSTDAYADLAIARMHSVSRSSKIIERLSRKTGAANGIEVRVDVQLSRQELYYVQWFCATNGWAYQLMTWGRIQDREAVQTAANQMIDRFSLLDFRRRAPSSSRDGDADFVSTNFQFTVHCSGSGWFKWENLDKVCQYASFGILNRDGAGMTVSAVSLRGLAARPEIIYRGLLIGAGFTDQDVISSARSISEGGLRGIVTDFDRRLENGKDYSYRFKILQNGDTAYLIAASTSRASFNKDEVLSNALSRVEIGSPPRISKTPLVLDAREKRVQRMLLNGIGVAYYSEQQYAQSRRFFEAVFEMGEPPSDAAYLGNLVNALLGSNKDREALDALERYPQTVAKQIGLQADRAFLQARLGQTDLALTNYARLFETGYTSETYFNNYVNLLATSGQADSAMRAIEDYLRREDTPNLRLLQASLLKQEKKFEDAIALLNKQRELHPFHMGIAYSLADTLILAGRPSEAHALIQDLMKDQDTAASWTIKGRAEFALKWYRDAKASFERALKETPSDPDVKAWVDLASNTLGEGDNTSIKEAIDPVPLPPELAALPPSSSTNFGSEEGAYYSRIGRAIYFERGKELKRTDYYSAHTLNASGVSAFSSFQVAFQPQSEEIFVNRLEVRDGAGSLVSTGRVSDYYVLDDTSVYQASNRKALNIPVPGLQPGYSVEIVVTRREIGPPKEFTFLPYYFSQSFPAQENFLYLTGETGSVQNASLPAIKPELTGNGILWRYKTPPVARLEPLMPAMADYLPTLWLADASARWPDLVTNYISDISNRLALPPEQRSLAAQLTASATNASQKVAAIARYIQTNYTYKAIEFGRHARIPQNTADIIRNKYGDCKDHAVLAQQMLRAVGVPATLALVNSSEPIREDLPSLDQFNHMIVYAPLDGRDFFLDCTAKSMDLAAPWTYGLPGRRSLLLDAENPRFATIPSYPANASSIQVNRSIELTNSTDALVRERLAFKGVIAGAMRQYLLAQTAAGRRAYIAATYVGRSGELLETEVHGLDQPDITCDLTFTYRVRSEFQVLENQIVGNLPLGFEHTFLVDQPSDKRVSPFEIAAGLHIDADVNLNLPSNFSPKPPSEPRQSSKSRFAACDTLTEINAHGWHFSYHFAESAGRFPAGDYPAHSRALQETVDLLRPRLVGVAAESGVIQSSRR